MKVQAWVVPLGLLAASGVVINFDTSPYGQMPLGWTVAMAGPGAPPRWEIVKDSSARSQPYVLAQMSGELGANRFPLAVYDRLTMWNGDLSVRIKPVSGSVDQSGGLIFRYRDEHNYYLVRCNARDDSVAAYKVANGEWTPLAVREQPGQFGVHHEIPSGAWTILKVAARGSRLSVYVNHRRIMELDVEAPSAAGKVGLWTKGDSVTYFDEFRVSPR